MINVAVFGDDIYDCKNDGIDPSFKIDNLVAVLKRQYDNTMQLFVVYSPGYCHLVCEKAIANDVKYVMFLTKSPEEQLKLLTEDQKNKFLYYLDKADAIHIDFSNDIKKLCTKIINMSNWILVFWNGKCYGTSYDGIQTSFEYNKIVLDGLDDMKMMIRK